MKRLDELGVSPAPWKKARTYWVADAHGNAVALCYRRNKDVAYVKADARLIAAAPDLYEALCDAVRYRCEYLCEEWKRRDGGYCDGCIVTQEWKKALEKAGGAEQ